MIPSLPLRVLKQKEFRTLSWEKSSINPFFPVTRKCVRVTFFDTLFSSLKEAFESALPAAEDNR